MTIDPKAIPVGTLVEATHHGYTGFQPIEATDYTLRDVEVVRAFVRQLLAEVREHEAGQR